MLHFKNDNFITEYLFSKKGYIQTGSKQELNYTYKIVLW